MTTTSHPHPGSPAGVGHDDHGNPMAGPAAAIDRYDQAIDRLLRFDRVALDLVGELVGEHPDVAMGQLLAAYLGVSSTERAALDAVGDALAVVAVVPRTPREDAHLDVVGRWATGDWLGASRALDALLVTWPTDVLGLVMGHQLDFFLGDRRNLRDRIGRSLAALEGHDHHGFVVGMHAFGLEESGTYDAALAAGEAALAAHPDDVWALHAVAHVHEMRGTVVAGLEAMAANEHWRGDGLFSVHLWWHHALYLLEGGCHDDLLAVYDAHVRPPGAAPVAFGLGDAAALLWRLSLEGVDVGDRVDRLADDWAGRPGAGEPWFAFNDVHDVMALVAAGRLAEARHRVAAMDEVARVAPTLTTSQVSAEVGVPVARGLVAFGEGRPEAALGLLLPVRHELHRIGGSHAQRDVVAQTVIDAAVAAGQLDLAAALVRERLANRPTSVFGWSRRARVAEAADDPSVAAEARHQAAAQRDRVAAAVRASRR